MLRSVLLMLSAIFSRFICRSVLLQPSGRVVRMPRAVCCSSRLIVRAQESGKAKSLRICVAIAVAIAFLIIRSE